MRKNNYWHVGHDDDGFYLFIGRESLADLFWMEIWGWIMDRIGHPCCRKGAWDYVLPYFVSGWLEKIVFGDSYERLMNIRLDNDDAAKLADNDWMRLFLEDVGVT